MVLPHQMIRGAHEVVLELAVAPATHTKDRGGGKANRMAWTREYLPYPGLARAHYSDVIMATLRCQKSRRKGDR